MKWSGVSAKIEFLWESWGFYIDYKIQRERGATTFLTRSLGKTSFAKIYETERMIVARFSVGNF